MRPLLASLIALAACGSSAKPAAPPTTTTAAAPQSYPAPPYAKLFVKGTRQTYTVEAKQSFHDPDDPRADKTGTIEEKFTGSMMCTVDEVRELPSAIASHLDCQRDTAMGLATGGPDGYYVATADGLWLVDAMPTAAPTNLKERLLAWPPAEHVTEERDPANPGWGARASNEQIGNGLCWSRTWDSSTAGDEQLCVRDGFILSGSRSSDGAMTIELSYELANS